MRMRWGMVAVCAGLALASAGCKKKKLATGTADDPFTHVERVLPAATLANVPAGPALIGPVGVDVYGYPTQHVDRAMLRGMFARKEYPALTAIFEELQNDFEADPTREMWPIDASDAFASAESELDEGLDAWVVASPKSFAPYLARGAHHLDRGLKMRGFGTVKETKITDEARMTFEMAAARPDFATALTLRPKLVAARIFLSRLALFAGDPKGERQAVDAATASCPSCFRIRAVYLHNSGVRWGGSYPAMRAYAAAAASAGPMMKLLPGYIDYDKARGLDEQHRYASALVQINQACALGDDWEFLALRSSIENHAGDLPSALADIEKASQLRPDSPSVLLERATLRAQSGKAEDAANDLFHVTLISPTESNLKESAPFILGALIEQAAAYRDGNRHEDALRLATLAKEISPDTPEVKALIDSVVVGDSLAKGGIDPLEADVKAHPDSFEARQRFDYALQSSNQYDRIIASWNEYIRAHPDDGRAYLERGGAYYNSNQKALAGADARSACDRGVSEGCARAKMLGR